MKSDGQAWIPVPFRSLWRVECPGRGPRATRPYVNSGQALEAPKPECCHLKMVVTGQYRR